MDNDLDGSLFLMRMLAGPATAFFGFFVSLVATAPLVLYVVARWRSHRDPSPDPHLGLKFALHYFWMIAFHLLLGGIAILLYTLISDIDHKGSLVRAAVGLLFPAAIVLAGSMAFLGRTNDRVVAGVRRLFLGYNLLATGLVGFVGLVISGEVLFAKGGGDGVGYIGATMVVVYCGAWGLLAAIFGKVVLGDAPGAAPPAAFVPPAPPAPMPMHRD